MDRSADKTTLVHSLSSNHITSIELLNGVTPYPAFLPQQRKSQFAYRL
jgi:hypothetical protein